MNNEAFGKVSSERTEEVILPVVADVIESMQSFGWFDYTMFIIMLLISLVVGVYFGIFEQNQDTEQYLLGGRKMKVFPISMSLIASYIGGISLLGIPTEVYLYGTQYVYIVLGLVLMSLVFHATFLPVFTNLKLTSMYEYLERRFDRKVRLLGSFLYCIKIITWLPIAMYVPALAFNQGISIHLITPIVCMLCILYTSLGGLKAVVWADVVQAIIIIVSITLVAIKGTINVGGFSEVLARNRKSGRLELPSFDMHPYSLYTFWSLFFGGFIYYLDAAALGQDIMQRFLSMPSIKHSRRALKLYIFGMAVIIYICGYCGLLIYATYYQCDPLTTSLAKRKDQLMPLLVMYVLADWPGLIGIFMAGVFSASLSSLSTGLNSMAAVILEDFFKLCSSKPLTERQSTLLMKLSVIVFGGICVGLVYVVENLGTILQLSMSMSTIASGPYVSLFIMGMMLPWVNSKGVLIGGLSSIVFMFGLCLKAQFAVSSGDLVFQEKPLTTEGCNYNFTPMQAVDFKSNATGGDSSWGDFFPIYRISYLWYTGLGATISITVGLIVSFLTGPTDPWDIEPQLLAPFVNRALAPSELPDEANDGLIHTYDSNEVPIPVGKEYELISTNENKEDS